MHEDSKKILNLMFRPGESLCLHHNAYSYHSFPLETVLNDNTLAMVPTDPSRPIEYIDSSRMILCSLNPIKGFRKDENVYKYRNFLLELDVGDIKSQVDFIHQMGIPYSAMIFSVNKSCHTLISLSED